MATSASSVEKVLAGAVATGAMPNAVAVAAGRDGTVMEWAAGPRVAGEDLADAAGVDSRYQIKSMTKLVTTVAALQLIEEGAFDLDTPVERHVPDFARVRVLEGWDGDTPRLRAPRTPATIRQLLTHTAGLAYWFWNADIVRWQRLTGRTRAFDDPMVRDPGTAWEYSVATDWLGRLIEAVDGVSLDVAFDRRVFHPLGMTQTGFRVSPAQRATTVPVHTRDASGAWVAGEIVVPARDPAFWSGGGGLWSTPRDYLRFLRTILRGGELDGARLLSEQTVDQLFTGQIGDLPVPAVIPTADPATSDTFRPGPGHTWSFGLLLNTEDVPGRRRAWSGAWAGLCNTHYWIDRTTGITAALFSQSLPFVTPESMRVYQEFETALYASL